MQVTLVGLPGSGKTTVFNALTAGQAETGTFSGGRAAPNIGVVKVPDPRVDRLAELFRPRKVTYADVTFVDVGLPAGAAREGSVPAETLAQIRVADALIDVARAFEDTGAAAVDPWRDVAALEVDFALADLDVIERRLERLRTTGRHGTPAEREQNAREAQLLERLEPHLSSGQSLRALELTSDEERLVRGYRFLTQKPMLVVLNLDEARLTEAARLETETPPLAPRTVVAALSGRIEAELTRLAPDDAGAFMGDLGIAEPSRERVIGLTYRLLGLISFLTAGEDECRAWTIVRGATAVDAAAAIHSDLARGFIRAEVVGCDDLLATGSIAEARRRGLLRSEGKSYVVRDGDVVQVLFNVSR